MFNILFPLFTSVPSFNLYIISSLIFNIVMYSTSFLPNSQKKSTLITQLCEESIVLQK